MAPSPARSERLDLRGVLCPVTWARTRYALSRLSAGDELLVELDHRPAFSDIQRNAEELGHEVLAAQEAAPGVWVLRLKRGAV